MKVKNNRIDLNAVLGVESIDDNQAEKCAGGNFIVDLGDYGSSGTTAPYLVRGNERTIYVGGPLEQLTLSDTNSNDSFSIEWLDARSNVLSNQSLNDSETTDIFSGAIFARIVER